MRSLIGLALVLLASFLSGAAQAEDRIWDGGSGSSNSLWSDPNNWSGNQAPESGDTVQFSSSSSKSCTIDANVNVAGFTIASGYTATITQAAGKTITVGSTGFSQADGTFAGGDSAISITGPMTFSGGSFTATSGTLTAQSAWTVSGSPTFSANGGTVAFAVLYATTQTVTPGSFSFNNVTITGFGSYSTQTISGTLVVGGALVFNINSYSGNLLNGGVIQALGDITMSDAGFATGSWGPGSATLQIAGTGAQTLAGVTSGHFPNVEVAKPSGALTVTGSPVIVGSWTWTSGDSDFGSSTMVFATPYGGSQTITPGTVKYNNVSIKGFGQYGTQTISGTLSVGGNLTLGVTDYSGNRLDGGVIQLEGNLAMGSSGFGTLNPGPGSATIQFTGTGDQTLSSPAAGYFPSLEVAKPSGTLTVTDSPLVVGNWTYTSGTVDFGTSNLILACAYNGTQSITPGDITYGNVTIRGHGQGSVQTVNGTMTVGGALTFGTSGYGGNHLNGGTISALSDVTMTSSDFGGGVGGAGSATVVFAGTGNQTLTGSDTGRLPNVVVQKDSGTLTMSGAIYVAGDWNHLSGDVSASGSSTTFAGGVKSQISGNAVFGSLIAAKVVWQTGVTINDSITCVNDLQLASNSLSIPNSSTVSVGGNIVLGTSGTSFSTPHSAFVLNGTGSQNVDFGTYTIHSLEVSNTTGTVTFVSGVTTDFYSKVTFEPGTSALFTNGKTYAFDNLIANGTSAQPITFASTSAGQTWALKLPLRYAVYHISVSDSDASSGAPVTAINSANSGHNTNWNFGTPAALAIATPNASITSPAWVEGTCGVDVTSVQASINGGTAIDTVRLSASSWFPDNAKASGASLGITLNPSSATAVSILATSATGDTNTATQSITWTPTDLTGQSVSTVLKLRQGDSLLLTETGTGSVLTIDANGDGTADYTGAPGDQFAYQYSTPGSFTAEAKIDGVSVGSIALQVMEADLHAPIADAVGYLRIKNVVVTPAALAGNMVFASNDPLLLVTSTVGSFNNSDGQGTQITLLANHRGTPILLVRLGDNGPILGYREIDEFTFEISSKEHTFIDADSRTGYSRILMRPFISQLDVNLAMFGHTSTFAGGASTISLNTTANADQFVSEDNSELVASIPFAIEVPVGESMYCFSANIVQDEATVGEDSTNGHTCTCKLVFPHCACVDEDDELTLELGGNDGTEFTWFIWPEEYPLVGRTDDLTQAIHNAEEAESASNKIAGFQEKDRYTLNPNLAKIHCGETVSRTFYTGRICEVYDVYIKDGGGNYHLCGDFVVFPINITVTNINDPSLTIEGVTNVPYTLGPNGLVYSSDGDGHHSGDAVPIPQTLPPGESNQNATGQLIKSISDSCGNTLDVWSHQGQFKILISNPHYGYTGKKIGECPYGPGVPHSWSNFGINRTSVFIYKCPKDKKNRTFIGQYRHVSYDQGSQQVAGPPPRTWNEYVDFYYNNCDGILTVQAWKAPQPHAGGIQPLSIPVQGDILIGREDHGPLGIDQNLNTGTLYPNLDTTSGVGLVYQQN